MFIYSFPLWACAPPLWAEKTRCSVNYEALPRRVDLTNSVLCELFRLYLWRDVCNHLNTCWSRYPCLVPSLNMCYDFPPAQANVQYNEDRLWAREKSLFWALLLGKGRGGRMGRTWLEVGKCEAEDVSFRLMGRNVPMVLGAGDVTVNGTKNNDLEIQCKNEAQKKKAEFLQSAKSAKSSVHWTYIFFSSGYA